ncbi:hypothetical protein [Mesorhizobium sp. ES1-3]|uniref:hypothetical protein n=1 Tax=Mesorhizobium sp. ES1-3 TaxID=2876628 RepID=UPI001CC91818|nr:hypothetical protein [Mesorhizobium sp. ES1-3]MBZ9669530.1 hypothetical protein [Mesorhizobium sp. ES1-3]
MDRKILSYGRGGAIGVFLGHILYMIFHGDVLRSILESAAIYAVIGISIVLLIERGFKRWGTKQP